MEFRFFTYCTSDYLLYAVNSMESALKFHPKSKGHIICVDSLAHKFQAPFTGIYIEELAKFPRATLLFKEALKDKTTLEAIISIKPSIMIDILDEVLDTEVLVYIDTDVFFYSSLVGFEQENSDGDFIAIQHMYPTEPTEFPFGKFNAGLIITRKSRESLEILREWERLCINWCSLVRSEGRYADQGYLEELVRMPRGKGVKSSVLNIGMHYLRNGPRVSMDEGRPYIEDSPLIAFHFHGLKLHGDLLWTGINRYGFAIKNYQIYKAIYKPLVKGISKNKAIFAEFQPKETHTKFKFPSAIELFRRVKKTLVKIPK